MSKSSLSTLKKQNTVKAQFLEVLGKKAGNVTEACRAVNIDRKTYYNWAERDEAFKASCDAIKDSLLDFMESQLLKNIQAGKEASLIFALKCQGKKRGYIERQQVEHSGDVTATVIYGDEG